MAIQLAIKESGLFYYTYSNKLCLSSTSNVLFPLRFLRFNTASRLNLCQSRQSLVANLRLLSFLVQSALLGWFGGLASLKYYGNKALWQYGNEALLQ